jgi:hypothetical protein
MHSWEAPVAGMLKVNWEVAIAQGENLMGVGRDGARKFFGRGPAKIFFNGSLKFFY